MFCSGILRDHLQKSLLKFYYVKYMGIKSDDTADFREHVIISYLLWSTALNAYGTGSSEQYVSVVLAVPRWRLGVTICVHYGESM